MPKVSVVIPNYNHAQFLRQRIDTVLQQTYQDLEVILMDDCSSDKSRSIISEYAGDSRVRIEFNDKNSGSTFRQWNKGVRLARGTYVWIAESDDYANERLLERLVAVLDAEPKVAFAYCRSWRVSADNRPNGFSDPCLKDVDPGRWAADFCVDGREECRHYLARGNTVCNASAVVFPKAVYERVGGADESLRLCGDWKLWAAMALRGRVAYLAEPLNYYRFHDASSRSKSKGVGSDVREGFQVACWILWRAKPEKTVAKKVFDGPTGFWVPPADFWVPMVMGSRVSLSMKWAILRYAWAVDPHSIRSAVRPALRTLRLKFLRHWREVR
jgi:glycosyltransferase involved in cell wall biosynthesis